MVDPIGLLCVVVSEEAYGSRRASLTAANRTTELVVAVSPRRPGGQILIPNFLRHVPDCGYMESFMDWHLIYRNRDDMAALAAALPAYAVANWQIFDDKDRAITYLLVNKASSAAS